MLVLDATITSTYQVEYTNFKVPKSAAQTRLHALEVCDLLFARSRAFRTAAAAQFPALLEASVGFRPARPLPGPPHLATQLRERALDAVERWNNNYGVFYQQARVFHSSVSCLEYSRVCFTCMVQMVGYMCSFSAHRLATEGNTNRRNCGCLYCAAQYQLCWRFIGLDGWTAT